MKNGVKSGAGRKKGGRWSAERGVENGEWKVAWGVSVGSGIEVEWGVGSADSETGSGGSGDWIGVGWGERGERKVQKGVGSGGESAEGSGKWAWSGERSGVESRGWSGVELGRDSFERPRSKASEAQKEISEARGRGFGGCLHKL